MPCVIAPALVQLEAVAGVQPQHDGVFAGGGLQFEIECAAEPLAQGQAPGAIDAAAERRMDDQLRAAGFVEKTLHHQCFLGRQGAEGQACRSEEHTSELQSLMRISYAVFCLKKKKTTKRRVPHKTH